MGQSKADGSAVGYILVLTFVFSALLKKQWEIKSEEKFSQKDFLLYYGASNDGTERNSIWCSKVNVLFYDRFLLGILGSREYLNMHF